MVFEICCVFKKMIKTMIEYFRKKNVRKEEKMNINILFMNICDIILFFFSLLFFIYIYIYIYIYRTQKWHLILPCLTLSIISYR